MLYYPFPEKYRYARDLVPPIPRPLSPDEVIARLRERLYLEAHNCRFYRARSEALAAEVAGLRAELGRLRARLDALDPVGDVGGDPVAA